MCSPATEDHAASPSEATDLWNPGWRRAGPIGRTLALPCIGLILLYRVTLSPLLGRQCRFEPTCSRYGLEAYRVYGILGGTAMTARRIWRCRPLGARGYDPVPHPREA